MTNLEFITSQKIDTYDKDQLYDYIVDKILDNSILVLEKNLDPMERMELIAHGLGRATDGIYPGVKLVNITVSAGTSGFLRSKARDIHFNLITPGNSTIEQKEEGHFSIITEDGNQISTLIT
ncbi:MAG: hypothetical protein HeimC2_36630 [Candidatus Heimdallarchaeota archaeon LC_2]|nr:MAG: hypothetical protein HeimC2_36630 [Candidatus Heimdallarchaeota archaeon LC_2]